MQCRQMRHVEPTASPLPAYSSKWHACSTFEPSCLLPSPSQAEIAEVQNELAGKRRELEALEAELKEVKDRVAATKDAGGCKWPCMSCGFIRLLVLRLRLSLLLPHLLSAAHVLRRPLASKSAATLACQPL